MATGGCDEDDDAGADVDRGDRRVRGSGGARDERRGRDRQARATGARCRDRLEGRARAGDVRRGQRAHQLRRGGHRPAVREPLARRQGQRWRDRARCHRGHREGRRVLRELRDGGGRARRRRASAGEPGHGRAGHVAGQLPRARRGHAVRDRHLRDVPDVGAQAGVRVRRGDRRRRDRAACRRGEGHRDEAVHRDRRVEPEQGRAGVRGGDGQGEDHRERGGREPRSPPSSSPRRRRTGGRRRATAPRRSTWSPISSRTRSPVGPRGGPATSRCTTRSACSAWSRPRV